MLTVAIPTFNRDEVLVETINYFLKLKNIEEILVVDQTQEHKPHVNEELTRMAHDKSIVLIRLQKPSLTRAKNVALSKSKSQITLFVDDDVIPNQEMLDEHIRVHTEYPEVAIVAGSAFQERNEFVINHDMIISKSNAIGCLNINGLIVENKNMPRYKGCNHSVKTSILRNIGGYDERYVGVAMCEETDVSIRILDAHKSIYLSSKAGLFHHAFPSGGCRKKNILDTSAAFCICLFALKNRRFLGIKVLNELRRAFQNLVLNKSVKSKPLLVPIMVSLFIYALTRALLSTLKQKTINKVYT